MTAAVLAQVHHEPVDSALGLELFDQARDVARRAHVVLVAAAARREILVKARHRNYADSIRLTIERDFEELLLRSLLLELDLVANELDHLFGRSRRRSGR
jgi:hypothetical protein